MAPVRRSSLDTTDLPAAPGASRVRHRPVLARALHRAVAGRRDDHQGALHRGQAGGGDLSEGAGAAPHGRRRAGGAGGGHVRQPEHAGRPPDLVRAAADRGREDDRQAGEGARRGIGGRAGVDQRAVLAGAAVELGEAGRPGDAGELQRGRLARGGRHLGPKGGPHEGLRPAPVRGAVGADREAHDRDLRGGGGRERRHPDPDRRRRGGAAPDRPVRDATGPPRTRSSS